MSGKRQATTDLNHENWDQEDSNEPEDTDTESFKMAPKEVLEKRVIRTAKRRSNMLNSEGQKSVFSGFGGFNKAQQTSFDFLANLTNGNKTTLSTTSNQSSSSLFTAKPFTSQSPGLFTASESSKPVSSLFEKPTPTTSSTVEKSPVADVKTDSKLNESPFKIQASSTPINSFSFTAKPKFDTCSSSAPQTTNNLFVGQGQNIFAKNTFKSSNPSAASPSKNDKSVEKNDISEKKESDGDKDKIDDKKIKYYTNIKGLNISVSEWIKKHVDESPLCILTPIFKDYEKHLKEIQDEYFNSTETKSCGEKGDFKQILNSDSKVTSVNPGSNVFAKPADNSSANNSVEQMKANNFSFGLSTSSNTPVKSTETVGFSFGNASKAQSPTTSNAAQAPKGSTGFSFQTTSTASSILPTATTSSSGFTFGMNTSPQTSLFSTKPAVTSTIGNSPFSFGAGKPFSFNSNIQKKEEVPNGTDAKEDEDEPPKVEYTPMVEENSVFDKKCKIFVKKDGNFVDKGVGTVYIKKIEESGKHQLLVRANTTLGNILLNLVLGSSIPTQRMGKNNVMLVCIPTPDAKPPPTPVLIRVKTSEEADELLETLNKYKM